MILSIPLGRLIFALLFALCFIGLAIWAYAKDKNYHRLYYNKTGLGMLIGIVVFFAVLYAFIKL